MNFELRDDFGAPNSAEAVLEGAHELHSACGVYTRPPIVNLILDAVDWRADLDLTDQKLLEPACGDGVFVLCAARRLLRSFADRGQAPTLDSLSGRIRAYEIHAGEAAKGRSAVVQLLLDNGLARIDADAVSQAWIKTADFLLETLNPGPFSHVVGNPPYLRWATLPASLRVRYERVLPAISAKGDLFLPFLDRGIEALKAGGKLGFLCTDRWKYMGFAEKFRAFRLPQVDILKDCTISPIEAYLERVSTYPSVVVMQRRCAPKTWVCRPRIGVTLKEAGFEVRVGPALGCTDAFVLPIDHAEEVEAELIRPWLSPSDVQEGSIRDASRVVICMYDDEGKLRDIERFPKARAWLSRYRHKLEQRSIVRKQGAVWYRPIDKVTSKIWKGPKLLVPELSKTPRLALDTSGAIPAHSIYAIQPALPQADLHELSNQLTSRKLSTEMARIAPRANGGYLRCYKRFLEAIVLS